MVAITPKIKETSSSPEAKCAASWIKLHPNPSIHRTTRGCFWRATPISFHVSKVTKYTILLRSCIIILFTIIQKLNLIKIDGLPLIKTLGQNEKLQDNRKHGKAVEKCQFYSLLHKNRTFWFFSKCNDEVAMNFIQKHSCSWRTFFRPVSKYG